ncbi:MAG: GNAT family N-acetyltransferase [Lachnospiraceae bacterium]|nr:GNAT family N-acetyltransferase [Lachnospiraceae bacterium]
MSETETIVAATKENTDEILALYDMQKGREFCPWEDEYPSLETIEFDLKNEGLFVMKNDEGMIIAAISIDKDERVEALEFWTDSLRPGGELSRLAVHPDYQNRGIAPKMIRHCMSVLKERGYKSVHYMVNKLNVKAMRSYAKLDMRKAGEVFMYQQPFICYEKEL